MDVIKPIIDTKELIAKENILKEFDYAVEQEKKIENVRSVFISYSFECSRI